jgi:hypothetical protein
LQQLQAGILTPFSANEAIKYLKNATNTTSPIYGGDIVMTLQFAEVVLNYENGDRSSPLELISQQYRDFVQVRFLSVF